MTEHEIAKSIVRKQIEIIESWKTMIDRNRDSENTCVFSYPTVVLNDLYASMTYVTDELKKLI